MVEWIAGCAVCVADHGRASPRDRKQVLRFRMYDVELDPALRAYCAAVVALPAMEEWMAAARAEPWVIDWVQYPPIRA
jgi:alkylhydroperoxidase family enzyme